MNPSSSKKGRTKRTDENRNRYSGDVDFMSRLPRTWPPSYWGKYTNWIILYYILESVLVNKWQTIKPEMHELWIHSLQNLHILHLKERSVWVGTLVVLLCCPANSHGVCSYLHPPPFHIYGTKRASCKKHHVNVVGSIRQDSLMIYDIRSKQFRPSVQYFKKIPDVEHVF